MHKVEEAAEPRAIAEGTKWWVEMGDGEVGTKGGLTPPGGEEAILGKKKGLFQPCSQPKIRSETRIK